MLASLTLLPALLTIVGAGVRPSGERGRARRGVARSKPLAKPASRRGRSGVDRRTPEDGDAEPRSPGGRRLACRWSGFVQRRAG